MKLILLTSADFFVEEDKIITALFDEGLDILHLRKPDSEPVFCERLLSLIPDKYLQRIVVHDHFYLKEEFNLMGIHLSRRHDTIPTGYKGQITRTCYSIPELRENRDYCEYLFLRNIYQSISEPENRASFTHSELLAAQKEGFINRDVMAEGGVNIDRIPEIRELGCGGVAIRGDIWGRFDIHSHRDYKDLISHFRNLRKKTME